MNETGIASGAPQTSTSYYSVGGETLQIRSIVARCLECVNPVNDGASATWKGEIFGRVLGPIRPPLPDIKSILPSRTMPLIDISQQLPPRLTTYSNSSQPTTAASLHASNTTSRQPSPLSCSQSAIMVHKLFFRGRQSKPVLSAVQNQVAR